MRVFCIVLGALIVVSAVSTAIKGPDRDDAAYQAGFFGGVVLVGVLGALLIVAGLRRPKVRTKGAGSRRPTGAGGPSERYDLDD